MCPCMINQTSWSNIKSCKGNKSFTFKGFSLYEARSVNVGYKTRVGPLKVSVYIKPVKLVLETKKRVLHLKVSVYMKPVK